MYYSIRKPVVQTPIQRYMAALYNCGAAPDVPDQQLDPPEPRSYVTWDEYIEHEADRLNDEEKEREYDND